MNERMSVQRKKRTNIESALQAPTHDEAHTTAEAPQIVEEVLSTSGQSLDDQTRAFMEPRYGHDFSRVRVHIDDRAAASAEAVGALAYTVGRDIVFGAGRYIPSSTEGQRLLAHELTHVVQQDRKSAPPTQVTSQSSDAAEAQAILAEGAVGSTPHFSSVPTSVSPVPAAVIQRKPSGEVSFAESEASVITVNKGSEDFKTKRVGYRTRMSLADLAIMNHVTRYASAIKEGYDRGYKVFADWYRVYEKSKESSTDEMMKKICGWILKAGLKVVFGPEEEFFKELATKAWELAMDALSPIEANNVEQFLGNLNAAESKSATKLLDAPEEFRTKHPAALSKAKSAFVDELEDKGEGDFDGGIPPSVMEILHQAGIGDPGTATAEYFAERWLTAHIQAIYMQNTNLTIISSRGEIGVMAEISALRALDPETNHPETIERIYEIEQHEHLPENFRTVANINVDDWARLRIRLAIDEDLARLIVESRQTDGLFSSAKELTARQLISDAEYNRIKSFVAIGR